MELEKSDAWQRHQQATVERLQKDLARYSHPVIRGVGLFGVAYLSSWAAIIVLGAGAVSMPAAIVAAFSAAVVVLGAPAFALAVGVERHLRGRLEGRGC
jgi:hypothetical protein